ncbi:MAG: M1 family aminopeptidase [bacterium]
MKKAINLFLLFALSTLCFGQKTNYAQERYPLVVDHYDLELSFDFKKEILKGVCNVTIENKSDSSVAEIPFLLYRLMKVTSVQNQEGNDIDFVQRVVSFDDFDKLQVNAININENIKPHSFVSFRIHYSGYLLGYQEAGMKYIKERISPNFTLIRNDSYSYPVLAKPSVAFLRKNITSNDFTSKLKVTVPDSLMVANGGHLLSKKVENGNLTYSYESKKPNWRIDVAISQYQFESTERLDIFYFQKDSVSAQSLLNHGNETLNLYAEWWGELKNDNSVTLIETEKQSGGQADETAILLPQESFNGDSYGQIYHELSHLWNVRINEKQGLSPRWEEGLAVFCEYYVDEHFNEGRKGLLDRAVNMTLKRLKRNFDSEPEMYDIPMYEYGNKGKTNYSYKQGMVMFTVLYKWLGKENFDWVIRSFYEQYHNTGATTIDFTQLWEKTLNIKGLRDFFDDWMYTTEYTAFIKNNNSIDEIVNHYAKRNTSANKEGN